MIEKKKYNFNLILLDIDGTLINDEKEIDHFTKTELRRIYYDLGIQVALLSSRMPQSMKLIEMSLGFPVYIGAYNGALIFNRSPDHKKEIFDSGNITNISGDILSVIQENKVSFGIYTRQEWIVDNIDYWTLREIRGTRVWPSLTGYENYLNNHVPNDHVYKIMARGDKNLIENISQKLEEKFSEKLNIYRNKPSILEIFSSSILKGNAVDVLSKYLGIDKQNMMAFGDGGNDKSMIENVGWGVAMGNASNELKNISDEITLSNNENGIGLILRKYFPSPTPLVFSK